jgi:hypothetical protein
MIVSTNLAIIQINNHSYQLSNSLNYQLSYQISYHFLAISNP